MMTEELKTKSLMPHWMSMGICLGGIVLAYSSVCISELGALLKLKNNLTNDQLLYQLSIATSCFNFGTLFGPLLYTKMIHHFGELKGLLYIDIFGCICILVQLIKLQFLFLAIPRFFLGILIGLSTSVIPVFINSIAPSNVSGRIGTYNQLFQVSGVLIAYLMGYFLDDNDKNDEIRWRIFLGLPILAFVGRQIILQFVYPYDSIERMIKMGQTQRIKQFCQEVYENPSQAVDTLIQLKSVQVQSPVHQSTRKRRLMIAIVVIASNQLSGINAILFYAKQLFNKITNNQNLLTQTLMVVLAIIQIIATVISSLIVDRKGRRPMLLSGYVILVVLLVGIFLSDTFLSASFHSFSEILIVVLLFLHIFVMNMTLGAICIVYCAEIVEDITWVIITLKIGSLSMALGTDYMIQFLGIGKMFLLFGALTFIVFLFLRGKIIETKGLEPNQIYPLFEVKPQKQSLLHQHSQENKQQYYDIQQQNN